MLDQHAVFEHTDLDAVVLGAHDHDPIDALTTRKELRLADDRTAAAGIAAVAPALLLRLEPRGTAYPLGFIARLGLLARSAYLDHRVRWGILAITVVLFAAATACATANRRRTTIIVEIVVEIVVIAVALPTRTLSLRQDGQIRGLEKQGRRR